MGNNLIETKEFITPVVNLQETAIDNQISFLGFVGNPAQQKKAQLYSITEKGKLIENKRFVFELAENTNSTFFSAHYGNFINTETKNLVILVADPSTGTKVYVWSIKEGEFLREYAGPYVINPENKKSLPVSSKTNKAEGRDEIIISFGSPNRNIVKLNFLNDKITKEENIAKRFLQNQAGSIYFLNDEETKELIVFNGGNPTQSKTFVSNKEENPIINNPTQGTVNHAFFINNEPALLTNFNKIYFYNSKQTINLNPLYKHKQFIKNTANKITFIDNAGSFLIYEIIDNQANLINKEESMFQGVSGIAKTESLQAGNQTVLTAKTKEKNYFVIKGKQQKPIEKEEIADKIIPTKQDTTILTANKKEYIFINIDSTKEFLKLTIEEKPETLELNLDSMAFVWKPLEKNAGNNILKYNIEYNVAGGALQKQQTQGTTTLTKEIIKEINQNKKVLYVNVVPSIKTEKTKYEVQAKHTLDIAFTAEDINKEQKTTVSYEPLKQNAEIFDDFLRWTPENNQYGEHEISLIVKDQYSESRTQCVVFVDTVKQINKSSNDFVLTVNQEFIHDVSISGGEEYNKIQGPENIRITKEGKLHWIPIATQLGNNEIIIERKNKDKTDNYIINTFVNSPPIISFRPDEKEYLNLNEEFIFQLKSFDSNLEQKVFWSLDSDNKDIRLVNENTLEWKADILDYSFYTVTASDSIDFDTFNGAIYVNETPKIISSPQKVVQIGESYNYEIIAEDNNTKSPNNINKENKLLYSLQKNPETMIIENNAISWTPTKEEVGAHEISVLVTDEIATTEQTFVLNVNDAPEIVSPDSITILVGDTLNYFINATDNNIKTKLTYSVRTKIEDMYLNANTGKITWVPTMENLGEHVVEVAVSDGFELGKAMKAVTVFVEATPVILNEAPTEAYVGLDYVFVLEGEDALGNQEIGKDIFSNIASSSFKNYRFNSDTFVFETTPQTEDIGNQKITIELFDKQNNKTEKTFNVLVLENSPCDPSEEANKESKQEKAKKEKKPLKRIYKIIIGALGAGILNNNY